MQWGTLAGGTGGDAKGTWTEGRGDRRSYRVAKGRRRRRRKGTGVECVCGWGRRMVSSIQCRLGRRLLGVDDRGAGIIAWPSPSAAI
jgi:hypothetical protein